MPKIKLAPSEKQSLKEAKKAERKENKQEAKSWNEFIKRKEGKGALIIETNLPNHV